MGGGGGQPCRLCLCNDSVICLWSRIKATKTNTRLGWGNGKCVSRHASNNKNNNNASVCILLASLAVGSSQVNFSRQGGDCLPQPPPTPPLPVYALCARYFFFLAHTLHPQQVYRRLNSTPTLIYITTQISFASAAVFISEQQ